MKKSCKRFLNISEGSRKKCLLPHIQKARTMTGYENQEGEALNLLKRLENTKD